MNVRFIIKMLGMMFVIETIFMAIPMAYAFFAHEGDFIPLFISTLILFGSGLLFSAIGFRANEHSAGRREGMLTVALTWVLLSLFGMLPFYFGGYIDNITDAYFETMSGFTTTGTTLITNVESLPHGILLWRSLTQWQGGIGMVVFTVALLPIFGGGASQMFDAETPGVTHERFRPRITQVAKRLWGVYIILTIILIALLWAGPMNLFDAINQAFTTISTGGYSTKNTSIGYWNSAYIDYVIILFMFIGGTNMTLIFYCFNLQPKKLLCDEEFHWYTGFIIVAALATTAWLLWNHFVPVPSLAFRQSLFQVTSMITTTGFTTTDYVPWGPFFWLLAVIMMAVCASGGSTSGGLKMGRFVIAVKILSNEFKKQTHPHAVVPVRMNGRVISSDTVQRVLAFVFAYLMLIIVSCIILAVNGLGFIESLGATLSAIGNVGVALGSLGPSGSYAEVSDISKWFLSFLMMVGRLEIFTVLTILAPSFWKQ
jgi:trk system potassium uptake protein TrkH